MLARQNPSLGGKPRRSKVDRGTTSSSSCSGSFGFSMKSTIRPLSSIFITPKALASSFGTADTRHRQIRLIVPMPIHKGPQIHAIELVP